MATAILKTCAKCKQSQPTELFNAHRCRPDGLRNICKTCQKAENRASYLRHQEKRQAEGRAKQAEWRKDPANAEKNRKAASEWYYSNIEVARERARGWSDENPERKRAADKAWREANRGRSNAHIRKYKIKKRQAVPAWADLEAIAKIYERCEVITRTTGVQHHVDHYYPLQGALVCGLHHESNLRVIPAVENRRKGNRPPTD